MNKKVINIVYDECQKIVQKLYATDKCKPTVIISCMDDKYFITLIHTRDPSFISYAYSAIITLDTDIENTIIDLYNKTM